MLRFVYTHHARANLVDRRIEPEWVERTVIAPELTEADPNHAERVRAFRRLPEREGRMLRVVYVRSGQDVRIVTFFLDRGRRWG